MAVGTVVSADQSGGGLGRRARDRNSPLSAPKAESDPWTTIGRERAAARLSDDFGGMGSRQGWLWAQSSLPISQAAASGGAQESETAHSPPRKCDPSDTSDTSDTSNTSDTSDTHKHTLLCQVQPHSRPSLKEWQSGPSQRESL